GRGRIAAGAAFAPRAETVAPGDDLVEVARFVRRGDGFGRFGTASADVQAAGAGRAEQRFVAREREQVDVRLLDRDRDGAGGLRGVDTEEHVVLAGDPADRGDVLNGAEHVRRVREHDEACVGADGFADVVGVDEAGVVALYAREFDAPRVVHRLQRAA